MDLSVLSALARSGRDPLAEAMQLAGLPRPVAADRLAGVLPRELPGNPSRAEARAIALRLVPLLSSLPHPESAVTAAAERECDRVMPVLLAGSVLSAALAFGLLTGAAFRPASHAGQPATAAGAPASRLRSEGQLHRTFRQWVAADDTHAPVPTPEGRAVADDLPFAPVLAMDLEVQTTAGRPTRPQNAVHQSSGHSEAATCGSLCPTLPASAASTPTSATQRA